MTDMMAPRKDFRSLRRKLASGKTLPDAAAESGMTSDEAVAYLNTRDDEQDKALLAFSDEAMAIALTVFKRAAREKNRSVLQKLVEFTSDGPQKTETKEAVIDIDAATALLKAAMQAKKMLRDDRAGRSSPEDQDKDLFDNPWSFRKSD